MKKSTWISLALIAGAYFINCALHAQVTFSRFDFFSLPFVTASIGPNAISLDPDVVGDGTGVYIGTNCAGTKGIDMTIPNTLGLFDQPSMGMAFRFRRMEARADFFVRGGTSFYVEGGDLMVEYRTSDGAGGFIDYGPYNTGHTLPEDGFYHEYTFIYRAATGLATVEVDGGLVWSQDGPDGRDYYWTGAPDAVVGTVMDGNCNGTGFLDYAYFFIPDIILGADYQNFTASTLEDDVQLDWTANLETTHPYQVERSKNGFDFTVVGTVASIGEMGLHTYHFLDENPGSGHFYYRIRQQDQNGQFSSTELETVTLNRTEGPVMEIYPNPVLATNGTLNINLYNTNGDVELTVTGLQGGVVLTADAAPGTTQLDLKDLSTGIYLLHCACGDTPLTQKLIVR
jgi:hypothetical protein